MYHREILDTRILNSGITMEPWALVEREDLQLTTVLDVIKFSYDFHTYNHFVSRKSPY